MSAHRKKRRGAHPESRRLNFGGAWGSFGVLLLYSLSAIVRVTLFGVVVLVCMPAATLAADADADVQRLQQQRDQQQIELRLKMQQQQNRAVWPSPDATADLQRRQLERDQQQRQQQLLEQQARSAATPGGTADMQSESMRRDLEQARAAQAAAEQMGRFEAELKMQADKAARDELVTP